MKRMCNFLRSAFQILRMLPAKAVVLIIFQVVTCGCVFAFSDLIEPGLYSILFSNLQDSAGGHYVMSCLIGGGIVLIMFTIQYLNDVILDANLFHSINALKIQAFNRFHRLPLYETQDITDGDIFNRINNGSDQAAGVWITIMMIVSEVLSLVLLFWMCVRVSLPLAGITAGLFLVTYVRIRIRSKQADVYSQKNECIVGNMENRRYAAVCNMESAVIDGTEALLLEAYRTQRQDYWYEKMHDVRREGVISAATESIGYSLRCMAPFALLGDGMIAASTVTTSLALMDSMTESTLSLSLETDGVVKAFAPVERLDDLINQSTAWQVSGYMDKPAVCAEHVSVCYGDRHVLRDISLSIPYGQKVALIGKNGSGKSTLLKTIMGSVKPTEGSVYIGGACATLLLQDSRRATFAYAPANAQLFSERVSDNIAMGADASETERVSDAVMNACLERELLSVAGDALSGGQAQRVNIARAFAHRAPVLVLDEPTSSVDRTKGTELIQNALGVPGTVVMTTHDPASLTMFERIVMLENGKIVFDGDYEKLSANQMFREWQGAYEMHRNEVNINENV